MPVIQGFGDEATYFLISICVIIIAIFAWWSTRLREDPIRTVLIFERRDSLIFRRSVVQHPVTISIMRSANVMNPEQNNSTMETTEIVESSSIESSQEQETPDDHNIPSKEDIPDSEIKQVIQRMDTESESTLPAIVPSSTMPLETVPDSGDGLRRRKPLNENKSDSTPTTSRNFEPVRQCPCVIKDSNGLRSDCCKKQGDDEVFTTLQGLVEYCESLEKNQEKDESTEDKNESETQNSAKGTENASNITTNESISDPDAIIIKLKYLNDTIQEVEGKLDEVLGDFKRRHFDEELRDPRKMVRLIFKGQVLLRDQESLSTLGFHDQCVVHCIVQDKRINVAPEQPGSVDPQQDDDVVYFEDDTPNVSQSCDVTLFLFIMVGFIMSILWWMRLTYAHLFTWQSTASLLGISGVLIAAALGTYFPDRSATQTTTATTNT